MRLANARPQLGHVLRRGLAILLLSLAAQVVAGLATPAWAGGWLGLYLQDLTPEAAAARGFRGNRGILVTGVVPGSPAANANLSPGDILLEVDGRRVIWHATVHPLTRSRPPGYRLEILFERRGKQQRTVAVLGDAEDGPKQLPSDASLDREYQSALQHYRDGRHMEAEGAARRPADFGLGPARFLLGLMADNGQGRPVNDHLASIWYRRAAESNHSGAMHNLGLLYKDGHGVPQDLSHAYYWIKRAADLGDENAQHNEGVLRPMLSKRDLAVAQAWLAYRPQAPSEDELAGLRALNDQPAAGDAVPQPSRSSATAEAKETVRETQRLLSDLGYRPGPADGVMGRRTRSAIEAFQRDHGLAADGRSSRALVASLRKAVAQGAPSPPDQPEQPAQPANLESEMPDVRDLDDF